MLVITALRALASEILRAMDPDNSLSGIILDSTGSINSLKNHVNNYFLFFQGVYAPRNITLTQTCDQVRPCESECVLSASL